MADDSSKASTVGPAGEQPHQRQPDHEHGHDGLRETVSRLDEKDAEERYREEAADNTAGVHVHLADPKHAAQQQLAPSLSNSEGETLIVAWEENDPENPYNWSSTRKIVILITANLTIMNSTMGSSLPSNAIPVIAAEWGVTSTIQQVLPLSMFLVGYILGPLVWAPLSEQYGRRNLVIGTFVMFMIWTMACALAPNWPAFLVFRLFCGVFASAPIAIVTGILADTFATPLTRGRAMALFMTMTVFGPLFAPIISGYCAMTIGWRWAFWIALMYGGATLVPLVFLPETFGPVLLMRRAVRMRKEDPKAQVIAPHELEKKSTRELFVVVLTRPMRMIAFELIVSSVCVYLSLVYAIFYMTFQAFPLIFEGIYHLNPGKVGLLFLCIGAGSLISMPVFYAYDTYLNKAIARGDAWTKQEEYRRLPLACVGGPVFAISMFWLGWSARASVSFVVPMLAGVPFGLGFTLIFMALVNYLTDAYEIFASSANAAASCSRSLLAAVLPLAAHPMFKRLTISGACSLLGGLSFLMCAIPFLFIWKGERIRAGSKFCIALRERRLEMERKVEEQRQRHLLHQQNHEEGLTAELPLADQRLDPDGKQKETV